MEIETDPLKMGKGGFPSQSGWIRFGGFRGGRDASYSPSSLHSRAGVQAVRVQQHPESAADGQG